MVVLFFPLFAGVEQAWYWRVLDWLEIMVEGVIAGCLVGCVAD